MSLRKTQSASSIAKADDDSDFALLDSESEHEEARQSVPNDNQLVVEKILGRKFIPTDENVTEEMYYIKWKGLSYLHASWERRADIEQVDLSAKQKIKRFLQSPQLPGILGLSKTPGSQATTEDNGEEELGSSNIEDDEVEYFNPDMVEIQRIISCDIAAPSHAKAKSPADLIKPRGKKRKGSSESLAESEDEENNVKYLVKWRGLSYDECTWERWEEIKPWYTEVWLFWYLQKPRHGAKASAGHPEIKEYKKLDESPVFGVSKVLPADELEPTSGLQLRDYQLEGVNWLLWNWWHKRPCILADEMGLGKTIQTVCFLHQLRYMPVTNVAGPFLVIAPLSLVDQWQSEVSTWSPDMNSVLLHGNLAARETIKKFELYHSEPFVSRQDAATLKKSGACKFHVLITTFEVAVKEIRALSNIKWEVMVIDEAHKLKNPSSRLFSTLTTLQSNHCLLLTGTPLQNKTEELWSLLNFADNNRFHDLAEFVNKFGDLKDAKQVASLHEVLRPYLLRRIKEDVEKSLPPKEETIVEVALTSVQKRFYRAIYEKNTMYLFRGLKASNQPSLMNVMMELRKCCNHPYLVRGVEERILSELPLEEQRDDVVIHNKLIECSGKLVLLDKLLPRLQSQGHKVLIFSQMVRVLNLLEDFLKFRGYSFERLDGTSKSSDRKEAVERFCKPSANRFVMLLSTKAGGLGLNLTAADTVIIYDSDWNPQNDLQAQARAHRIGQTKAVMVYRLLTRKTYEMQMFHQASLKLGLDRAVLAHARIEQEEEGHRKKKGDATITGDAKLNLGAKEIDELLKRGAYDVFREDDTEQNEFVEADIDSILQRRSHKIVYDDSVNKAAGSLGNFSKASFVSADEKEDVDINDPDFWRKAVGLKEDSKGILDEGDPNEELPMQRVRKQTKTYSGVTTVDEEQLKEFLKPLRVDKAEKKTLKAQQKEAALKERAEREEARKQKLQDEVRMKSDPRNWGSHGRDRVLRCLNMYGFGRWERIKNETGKGMMDAKDLEAFSRAYVMQCGVCASGQELSKNDSMFVRDAIRTAQEFHSQVQAGERTLDIPPSLSDEKFLVKLRSGQARKILNKLDALAKLINMVRASTEDLYKKKELEVDSTLDLDMLTAILTPEELAENILLGDVRPPWTRSTSWWNVACDRQLIIGVFKHGFGRYDLIREDETLMFKTILAKIPSDMVGDSARGPVLDGTQAGDAEVGMSIDPKDEALDFGEHDKMEDNDVDVDEDGGKVESGPSNNNGWPDPRHLNRLVIWLATSEAAKMTKAEFIESQKKEKKAGKMCPTEVLPRKEQASSSIDFDDNQVNSYQASLIRGLLDMVDFDSVSLVHKTQIQGLKKCEYILSLPLNYAELEAESDADGEVQSQSINQAPNQAAEPVGPESASNAQPLHSNTSEREVHAEPDLGAVDPLSAEQESSSLMVEKVVDDDAMVVDGDSSIHDRSDAPSSNLTKTESTEITEFEAIRLSATLILFGAPVQDVVGSDGAEGDAVVNQPFYSWARVQDYSQVRLTEAQLRAFYSTVWLPFCEQISLKKNLSYSQHKYLVPNPLLTTAEHHYAARGLCQIFLIRQQLLCAANFVMSHCYDQLQDYLRSPQGRNVDFMPVWWCPWIHDEGLLMGLIKYGFLSLRNIIFDPELPFNHKFLERFVRKVFLNAPDPANSLARFDIHSKREAEAFVRASLWQFPESKDLELRVMRILEDLTRHLPADHFCKVTIGANYRSLVLQLTSADADAEKRGPDLSKAKSDAKSNRSTARPPAISLKTFVNGSRKRRRMYVASYHPDCFSVDAALSSTTTAHVAPSSPALPPVL